MRTKNKAVFITLFAVLAAILFVLWLQSPTTYNDLPITKEAPKTAEISGSPVLDSEHLADAELENLLELQGRGLPEFRPLLQFCLDQYPQFPSFPSDQALSRYLQHNDLKEMWNNVHLESSEGEIYRVRTFVDQGVVGPVTRLAVYKEDEEGFPVLIELPEDEKINPDSTVLERYYSLGTPIHEEKALVLDLEEGEYFFETHNNELVRMDITSSDGVLNCQFSQELIENE